MYDKGYEQGDDNLGPIMLKFLLNSYWKLNDTVCKDDEQIVEIHAFSIFIGWKKWDKFIHAQGLSSCSLKFNK